MVKYAEYFRQSNLIQPSVRVGLSNNWKSHYQTISQIIITNRGKVKKKQKKNKKKGKRPKGT